MEQSGGRSRVLCWELVGLVCFAGGKSRQIKVNQGKSGIPPDKVNRGKSRQIKVNRGKSRQIKVNQGESREK